MTPADIKAATAAILTAGGGAVAAEGFRLCKSVIDKWGAKKAEQERSTLEGRKATAEERRAEAQAFDVAIAGLRTLCDELQEQVGSAKVEMATLRGELRLARDEVHRLRNDLTIHVRRSEVWRAQLVENGIEPTPVPRATG